MPPIDASYFFAAGLFFISLEIFIATFFLLFIGLGLLCVSFLGLFIPFSNAYIQLTVAAICAVLLMVFFRQKLKHYLFKKRINKERQVHNGGTGVVDEGRIRMHGTTWACMDDLSSYRNGDKIEIEKIENNVAVVKK